MAGVFPRGARPQEDQPYGEVAAGGAVFCAPPRAQSVADSFQALGPANRSVWRCPAGGSTRRTKSHQRSGRAQPLIQDSLQP